MSFVGRELELQEVRERFAEGMRLVTLVGPGGVGKTTLSHHICDESHTLVTEVWFCELAEASSIGRVCEELARAAKTSGIGDAPDAVETIGALIAKRGRVLVVLDNCEQLVPAIASALARWLDVAPTSLWLATSREALGLTAEHVLHVAPLSPPDAATLFVDRASAARHRRALSKRDDDAETIATIVRRLDGLPLAIELAAARMAILSAEDLLRRLETGLGALVNQRADVPERHQTMRATVAWSWSLLEPWEASTLEQCAVFRGGFTARAAEHVVDLSAFRDAPPLLDVMQALERKCLIRTYAPPDAPTDVRLALYEPVREYAIERPSTDEARVATSARHARYVIDAASRSLADLDGAAPQARAKAQLALSLEHDNLLRAHATASPDDAVRAMLALTPTLRRHASGRSELELLDATLARARSNVGRDHGWLRASRSRLMMLMSRFDDADADLREALRLGRRARDRVLEGRALIGLFSSAEATERFEAAARFIERAASVLDGTSSRWQAVALGGLAMMPRKEPPGAAVLAQFDAAEALWTRACDSGYEGTAHYRPALHAEHALLLMELGRSEDAARHLRRAFEAARGLGPRIEALLTYYRAAYLHWLGDVDASIMAYRTAAAGGEAGPLYQPLVLGGLAGALASAGHLEEAETMFEEADAMATLEPSRVALSVQRAHLDLGRCDRATARGRLDRASSGPTTSDVRLASLTLRAALDRPETRGLEVADDAAWFRLDGRDTPVVQRLLRRLLHELAVARIESPGRALGVDDVCRAVWPGERILPRAARRRVQVAISTLRASGLRDVLHTSDQGYMLDPKVRVNIVGAMR